MSKSSTLFVGMDVHKETIDIVIATNRLNGKVRHYGKSWVSQPTGQGVVN